MGRLRVPYQPDPPARAGPDDHWTLLAQDLRRLLYREFLQVTFCHFSNSKKLSKCFKSCSTIYYWCSWKKSHC